MRLALLCVLVVFATPATASAALLEVRLDLSILDDGGAATDFVRARGRLDTDVFTDGDPFAAEDDQGRNGRLFPLERGALRTSSVVFDVDSAFLAIADASATSGAVDAMDVLGVAFTGAQGGVPVIMFTLLVPAPPDTIGTVDPLELGNAGLAALLEAGHPGLLILGSGLMVVAGDQLRVNELSLTVVPEPASAILALVALGASAVWAQRGRRGGR